MNREPIEILNFRGAQLDFAVDLLRFACEWAEKNKWTDCRIRNNPDGTYGITAMPPSCKK